MAPVFTLYPSFPALRSQLLTNPPVAVPPVDDLVSLEEELKNLRNKSLARHKKAENDLKILDALHRKFKDKDKERDKGKIKDKVKIKREATGTPDPLVPSGPSSTPSSAPSCGYGVKAFLGAKTVSSKSAPTKTLPGIKKFSPPVASGSGASTTKDKVKKEKERVASIDKDKKKELKKKKRKRENDDSDNEEQPERIKKIKRSPDPSVNNHYKQKSPSKPTHSASGLHSPHSTAIASFALPRHVQHIPQRPIPAPPPTPGPLSPGQVTEDFSKLKPPPQTAVSTFWSHLEPWLRPIREEDVGLLEWDGDEETPFVTPPLGRHYTEIWDDEDNERFLPSTGPSKPTPTTASLPKWDPSTLHDADLTSHEKGHTLGPVHERLLSAMLPVPVLADGKPAAGGGIKSAGNSESKMINPTQVDEQIGKLKPFEGEKQPPKLNVQDMQERLMKELRSIGLLGDDEPDYAKSADDPLAAELRQCQRELRTQIAINKARRKRLREIAKSRLARNEFEEHTGALERSILAKYNQLQRRDMPKQGKKKKKSGGAGGGAHVVPDGPFAPSPHIHPAAWGLERGEDLKMVVDEELDGMVVTRQQFVDVVQPCLDSKQRERPGSLYGTPAESIFKGIEVPETKVKGS